MELFVYFAIYLPYLTRRHSRDVTIITTPL